jgi:hypothetical protein
MSTADKIQQKARINAVKYSAKHKDDPHKKARHNYYVPTQEKTTAQAEESLAGTIALGVLASVGAALMMRPGNTNFASMYGFNMKK